MTDADSLTRRRTAWRHLAIALAVVNALVYLLSRPAAQAKGLHDLIGLVFVVVALAGIRRDDDDPQRYGVRFEGVLPGREGDRRSLVRALIESVPTALRECGVAAAVGAVVFPLYALAWPLFNRAMGPRQFVLDAARWREIATELLAVAFAEEVFFRGYVQTRLADALGYGDLSVNPRAQLPAAARVVTLTALLFALTHVVVAPTLPRAVVFFPALLFGALRVWRGGVGAAIVLHAASNLFERWLEGAR